MSFSLYDATVKNFDQILGSISDVLDRSKSHFEERGESLSDVLVSRLIDDMLPLSFQVVSVAHHSVGALRGVAQGQFGPPQMPVTDYSGLQELIATSTKELDEFPAERVNDFVGRDVTFKMGDMQIPFRGEDFLMSFSLPNFFFHATTTYDVLRMRGVPLGKRNFLGQLRIRT